MSRYDSSSMQALSQLGLIAFRQFADIQVSSSTLHVCNGYKYLYTLGNTYTPIGNGQLAGIDTIKEESDAFAQDVTLWCAAVNSSQLYEPVNGSLFNNQVTIYDSFLDPNTFTPTNTPQLVWQGRINEVAIRFNDPDKGTHFEITGSTELRRAPVSAYFNKQTLQAQYSGDTFFDLQYLVPTTRAQWGQKDTVFTNGVPGGVAPQPAGGRLPTIPQRPA